MIRIYAAFLVLLLAGTVGLPMPVDARQFVPTGYSAAQIDDLLNRVEQVGAVSMSADEHSPIVMEHFPVAGFGGAAAYTHGVEAPVTVKKIGDFLILLRDRQIFSIRHNGGEGQRLSVADVKPIGAFCQSASSDDYIFSYQEKAIILCSNFELSKKIEIIRLSVDDNGILGVMDSQFIKFDERDGTRLAGISMVDGRLIFYNYLPVSVDDWRDALPTLQRRLPDGTLGEAMPVAKIGDLAATIPPPCS